MDGGEICDVTGPGTDVRVGEVGSCNWGHVGRENRRGKFIFVPNLSMHSLGDLFFYDDCRALRRARRKPPPMSAKSALVGSGTGATAVICRWCGEKEFTDQPAPELEEVALIVWNPLPVPVRRLVDPKRMSNTEPGLSPSTSQ